MSIISAMTIILVRAGAPTHDDDIVVIRHTTNDQYAIKYKNSLWNRGREQVWYTNSKGVSDYIRHLCDSLVIDDVAFSHIQFGFPGLPDIVKTVKSLQDLSTKAYIEKSVNRFLEIPIGSAPNSYNYYYESTEKPLAGPRDDVLANCFVTTGKPSNAKPSKPSEQSEESAQKVFNSLVSHMYEDEYASESNNDDCCDDSDDIEFQ